MKNRIFSRILVITTIISLSTYSLFGFAVELEPGETWVCSNFGYAKLIMQHQTVIADVIEGKKSNNVKANKIATSQEVLTQKVPRRKSGQKFYCEPFKYKDLMRQLDRFTTGQFAQEYDGKTVGYTHIKNGKRFSGTLMAPSILNGFEKFVESIVIMNTSMYGTEFQDAERLGLESDKEYFFSLPPDIARYTRLRHVSPRNLVRIGRMAQQKVVTDRQRDSVKEAERSRSSGSQQRSRGGKHY